MIYTDSDNELYKYPFIKIDHVQQSAEKKLSSGANQSYYDFCIDFFTKLTYAEATRKLSLDITVNRIKSFIGTLLFPTAPKLTTAVS